MEAKDYLRILTGDYIILPLYVSGCLPLRPLTPGQVRGRGGARVQGGRGASTGSGREGGGHGQGSRLLTNVGGKGVGGGDYDRFKIERRRRMII